MGNSKTLEWCLLNALNQDIYFDIPELYNTNDESKSEYFELLFKILDTCFCDAWSPGDKTDYIRKLLSQLFTRIKNYWNSLDLIEDAPNMNDLICDVIDSIKKHSKLISEKRLDLTNSSIQLVLKIIEQLDITQLSNYKSNVKIPEIVSYDIERNWRGFGQVRGMIKEEPEEYFQENVDSMKKVLLLIELGIFDFIQKKFELNKSQTNNLLSVLTGVNPELLKRYLNGYITAKNYPKIRNHNNPCTKENTEWITKLFNQNKLSIN